MFTDSLEEYLYVCGKEFPLVKWQVQFSHLSSSSQPYYGSYLLAVWTLLAWSMLYLQRVLQKTTVMFVTFHSSSTKAVLNMVHSSAISSWSFLRTLGWIPSVLSFCFKTFCTWIWDRCFTMPLPLKHSVMKTSWSSSMRLKARRKKKKSFHFWKSSLGIATTWPSLSLGQLGRFHGSDVFENYSSVCFLKLLWCAFFSPATYCCVSSIGLQVSSGLEVTLTF